MVQMYNTVKGYRYTGTFIRHTEKTFEKTTDECQRGVALRFSPAGATHLNRTSSSQFCGSHEP